MTASPEQGIVPGAPRLKVTVERADNPTCDIAVGDYFEINESALTTPNGPFCPYAIASVVPVLSMLQGDLPADHWLTRKPYICCPDARENVVMRIDQRVDGEGFKS